MTTNNSSNYQPTQYNVLSGGANGAINNIAPSTAGYLLTSNGASAQPTFQLASANMGTLIDTQTFTSNGTWTKPAGATFCNVLLIGSGGGGGSGRRDATSTNRQAGGGGTAGDVVFITNIPASVLGATEAVVAPAGGAGGAAQTVDTTDGNNGTSGTSATFNIFAAAGGFRGSHGQSTGSANTDGNGGNLITGTYNGFFQLPTFIASITSNNTIYETCVSLGGRAGGNIPSSNVAAVAGNSSLSVSFLSAAASTASGSAGAVGGNGVAFETYYACGGAGGSAVAGTFLGKAGGNGLNGSGGGGGSASINGQASGAGGQGGNAYVVVLTYQ